MGGFVSNILANLAYAPPNELAFRQAEGFNDLPPFAFAVQMVGRGLAWLLAGMTMGLGQGIALRSKRLLLYGFLGGIVGGLIGGLLFDPIDLLLLGGIGEMLCYQSYNVTSPLNARAAAWAEQNLSKLPLEETDLTVGL